MRKGLSKKEKRELKKKDRGFVDWMKISDHFFTCLPKWISEMDDPRNPSYIVYTQEDLVFMALAKNACHVESMRQMDEKFNEENCIQTLRILSGDDSLEEMPHRDTLNYYLKKLSPKCLADLRKKMVKSLLERKTFADCKLLGKYWRIIIDGTDIAHFYDNTKYEHLIHQTQKDGDGNPIDIYSIKILEAKLVLTPKIIISIDSEFVENMDPEATKQDCELAASKRLLARIKNDYPHLPVCLQGDAMFATEGLMQLCESYHWKYIFTMKEGRQPRIWEDYGLLAENDDVHTVKIKNGEPGTATYYNNMERITDKECIIHMYTFKPDEPRGETTGFSWLTNIELTDRNISTMIVAGRGRWKIENEGFNNQKNGMYEIEHLNCWDYNAIKNHYLLVQITDIINQLYLAWNPLVEEIHQSIKNTSSLLLESFRRHTITDEDVIYIRARTSVYLE